MSKTDFSDVMGFVFIRSEIVSICTKYENSRKQYFKYNSQLSAGLLYPPK